MNLNDGSEAFLAFQAALDAIEHVARTQTADTGKYTYTYADLGDVLEEVKRACGLHGLSISQAPSGSGDHLHLHLRLIHKNGGYVEFEPLVMVLPREAQAFGSALTYARRYQLLSVFGIATEDDDGRAATVAAQTQPGRRTEAERMIRESMANMDEAMRSRFAADFREHYGMGLSDLPANRHGDALTWSKEWASKDHEDQEFIAQAKGTA